VEKRILIIVPAFNEEENIIQVIDSLKSINPRWDILVINDCSLDRTRQVVEADGRARLVNLSSNLGIGGAVQTGFKYADRKAYDIAIQFDGDGQHKAEEIRQLLWPIESDEADVVIGSRFLVAHDGWKSTAIRRIGIRLFELVNTVMARQRITDNTSGFRAYNRRAIGFLAGNYPEDYPEPEAVVILKRNGFRLKEVATDMQERQGGASSILGLHPVYYIIKVMIAVFIASMKPKSKNQ